MLKLHEFLYRRFRALLCHHLKLVAFFILSTACRADIYRPFPGFEELCKTADFVGIVRLDTRDIPENEKGTLISHVGPHFNFKITSEAVIKGEEIKGQVARLADRRIGVFPIENILSPDRRFLVFLCKASPELYPQARFQWDEIHAEGSVLPVSPSTEFQQEKDVQEPYEFFRKIVADYATYYKELADAALHQQQLIEAAKPMHEWEIKIDDAVKPKSAEAR